jgi:hypothetical protein
VRDLRRLSQRCFWILVCSAFAALSGTYAQKDSSPDIIVLMDQLKDIETVHPDTVKQILELARKDPRAREYVMQKLPDMIRGPESEVWLLAIRLAGKLKAREAIPALQEVMSRRPFPAETSLTFAGIMRLDNDIVAKTLSQIGDPAIPAVAELLRSGDVTMRYRAVLVLRNIGSPEARKALRNRLPRETDPEVKKVIQDGLSTAS